MAAARDGSADSGSGEGRERAGPRGGGSLYGSFNEVSRRRMAREGSEVKLEGRGERGEGVERGDRGRLAV